MTARYTEISSCRICGNPDLESMFHLGDQWLTGVFPRTAEAQAQLTHGPLELVKCRTGGREDRCGLLQLRHSFPHAEMYGANYGYRSSLNRSMVEHLRGKVRRIGERVALGPGDAVLDIGSNDGTLLGCYAQPGVRRIGIDPTSEKFRRYYPPGVELVTDFFSAAAWRSVANGARAKVVTSIAMFYDLERPVDFVREIAEVLAADGIWVFEQSYMPSMLRTNSYDTICHEHLEYYALAQVKWILDRAGLEIVDVELNDVNGGSFSVTAAHAGRAAPAPVVSRILAEERHAGLDGAEPYRQFAARARDHREALRAFVRDVKARGETIFGYGASTKGNVILQYCGFTSRDIGCIAEVNEDKFGAMTPGTGIPIVSESEARSRRPHYLLVLPWHFRDNIIQREQAWLRGGGKLVFPLPEIEVVGA